MPIEPALRTSGGRMPERSSHGASGGRMPERASGEMARATPSRDTNDLRDPATAWPDSWDGRSAAAGGDAHRGSLFHSTAYRFSTPCSQRLRTSRVSSSARAAIRRGSAEASMNRSRSVSSAGSSETSRMQ
jgi:hypothetical protein